MCRGRVLNTCIWRGLDFPISDKFGKWPRPETRDNAGVRSGQEIEHVIEIGVDYCIIITPKRSKCNWTNVVSHAMEMIWVQSRVPIAH